MIKAGIIGGAGYTAGELMRILISHPEIELTTATSISHQGERVTKAHPDLIGETDLKFTAELTGEPDVVFICSGHGKSKAVMDEKRIPENAKVIDLSADHRIKSDTHSFVYGLPELNRDQLGSAHYVANPGCFATCIQLSLLPLAQRNSLMDEVHVTAITGSTGAGQNPTDTTHFSWRSNNASVYKLFNHQHLKEIRQSLEQLQDSFNQEIRFVPMRGAFTRGILAVSYTKCTLGEQELQSLYTEYYKDHPFVHISEDDPDVKQVVNSNKAILQVKKEGDLAVIVGVIDNLTKGASGQAVQNMNLMFGLDETIGLHLKTSGF